MKIEIQQKDLLNKISIALKAVSRKRMSTPAGRRVLKSRRQKGRKKLSA